MPHEQHRPIAEAVGIDVGDGVDAGDRGTSRGMAAGGKKDDSDPLTLIPQVNARRDQYWKSKKALGSSDVAVTADKEVRAEAEERRDRSLEIFGQPDWTLHQALAWICYRNPERMCDLSESKHRRLVLYKGEERVDADCAETLRRALVEGQFAAFRNGEAVQPAQWMGRTLLWSKWFKFHCHSKVVLEIWPGASVDALTEIERSRSQEANDTIDAIPHKKVRCAAKALRHLKLPEGMSADRRLEAVNSHLREHHDGMTVSPPILRKALKALAKVLSETSQNFLKIP